MYISRESVILEQQITHGYSEVLNMKLDVWFDIPSKYIEDSCVSVSVPVSIFSERLTDTSCQDLQGLTHSEP